MVVGGEMTSVLVILATSFLKAVMWLMNHSVDLPSVQSIVLYRACLCVEDYSISSLFLQ